MEQIVGHTVCQTVESSFSCAHVKRNRINVDGMENCLNETGSGIQFCELFRHRQGDNFWKQFCHC